MISGFIYPDVIDEIRVVCLKHIEGKVPADNMQRVIQRGEAEIVAIEEKDIRNFLTDIEGQLEEIKFAVDDDLQLTETQKVAKHVLIWLSEREANKHTG